MTPHEQQMWADIRAKGKFRYIALHGVIITGGLYAMVMTIAGYFIEHGFTTSQIWAYSTSSATHTRFFLFATAFGFIMGIVKWQRGEKAFAEAMAKEPENGV
jgi:hypothetical protein